MEKEGIIILVVVFLAVLVIVWLVVADSMKSKKRRQRTGRGSRRERSMPWIVSGCILVFIGCFALMRLAVAHRPEPTRPQLSGPFTTWPSDFRQSLIQRTGFVVKHSPTGKEVFQAKFTAPNSVNGYWGWEEAMLRLESSENRSVQVNVNGREGAWWGDTITVDNWQIFRDKSAIKVNAQFEAPENVIGKPIDGYMRLRIVYPRHSEGVRQFTNTHPTLIDESVQVLVVRKQDWEAHRRDQNLLDAYHEEMDKYRDDAGRRDAESTKAVIFVAIVVFLLPGAFCIFKGW